MRLSLAQPWDIDLDDEIGRGGFARVVAAVGGDGTAAVAKFVPKGSGAARDLLALELPQSRHLVPILDVGETEESWVLIMPRADRSLRDYLESRDTTTIPEALNILGQVATGLAVLDESIVHRDLKPENILLLDGYWAICDFGIARYVEVTTAPDTQKYSLSAPYAAPEQWRLERATPASDVYALGVIAYEVLLGTRPFVGPTTDDYRNQHLSTKAPVPGLPRRLASLVTECLLKAPAARPSAANIAVRLASAGEDSRSPGALALAEAQRAYSEAEAEQQRADQIKRSEDERRAQLFESASVIHDLLLRQVAERIVEEAPSAHLELDRGGLTVQLQSGELTASTPKQTGTRAFGDYGVSLDVIAHAQIEVTQRSGQNGYGGRSHSLYYCDFGGVGEYAWCELAFMHMFASSGPSVPYDLPPGSDSGVALGNVMGSHQLAWGFNLLRPDDFDPMIDRWLGWFAEASQNRLRHPSSLPEGRTTYPRRT